MAAYKADIVAQGQQLFLDRADQPWPVAIGEIGAPDPAAEDHVAHEGEALRFLHEHKMAGRVAWAVQNIQTERAELETLVQVAQVVQILAMAAEGVKAA